VTKPTVDRSAIPAAARGGITMATIGNSASAVTLNPGLTVIGGTVTGSAPAYAGFYAAVYGLGTGSDDVTIAGAVICPGTTRLDAGILLAAPGEVSNQGLIEGGAGLVIAGYGGASYIRNAARITANAGNGVYVYGAAVISNAGTILADVTGVDVRGGAFLDNAGAVTGATGAVLATYDGLGTIDNTGIIRGRLGDGVILAGTVNNQSSGTIAGSATGLYLYTPGAVRNAGLLTGGGIGIALGGNGTAGLTLTTSIENTGSIGGGAAGIAMPGSIAAEVEIYNAAAGRISGGRHGIAAYNPSGPVVQLGNAGLITGGVQLYYGIIDNTGSIFGVTAAYLQSGLLLNGNRLIGSAEGAIGGGITFETSLVNGYAVTYTVDGAFTMTNTGYVSGGQDGVILLTGGIVRNSGVITSRNGTAIESDAGAGLRLTNFDVISAAATGVQAAGGAYIVNTFNIIAAGDGISLAGAATLYNYGLIHGGAAAITAAGGYIYNSGTIAGNSGITLTGTAEIINAATGTIEGTGLLGSIVSHGTTTSLGTAAVALNGGSALYNYGRVIGNVTAAAGSYIYNSGKIIGGPSSGLAFYGHVSGKGVISLGAGGARIGGVVDRGLRIEFTGGDEALSLSNPGAFDGKLQHFTLTDTIDLTGISAAGITGETFAAGILTLQDGAGRIALTFANPRSFTGDSFAIFADGAGTGITLSAAPQMVFQSPGNVAVPASGGATVPPPGTVYAAPPIAPPAGLALSTGWLAHPLLAAASLFLTPPLTLQT
jgi:hypothetical protein